MPFTLVQLANFVRVAELGSLSKAAAMVRIAQPALSRQIRLLETEFGCELLIRHAWGVAPTPAGEALADHARRLLRGAEALSEVVRASGSEPRGRVALGMPTSLAMTLLAPLAQMLRLRHPLMRPHFVDGFSAALHARTLSGDLDLAVLYEERSIGPLSTEPLLAEDLVLVGRPGALPRARSNTADALARSPLVLPARPNRLRHLVDQALAAIDPTPEPILEMDSLPAILATCASGVACTVLPYSTVSASVARGELATIALTQPSLSRVLVVARPVDRSGSAAAAAVAAALRELTVEMAGSKCWRPLPLRS